MTRCESYPPCFGTIYFPTAPLCLHSGTDDKNPSFFLRYFISVVMTTSLWGNVYYIEFVKKMNIQKS